MNLDAAAALSDDVLGSQVFPFLPGVSLRSAAVSCKLWLRGLRCADAALRRRASWVWTWHSVGAGAQVCADDPAVAIGAGNWHPGGIAVANLSLTSEADVAWRVELESRATGDLLLGMTRGPPSKDLGAGYEYIMGRGAAPPSMFYGGRSLRCCLSNGDSTGPRVDYVQEDQIFVDVRMSRLRMPGQWVEFHLQRGTLRARDFAGGAFQWSVSVPDGEVWLPTVAWTGSRASLRLAPPEHFAAAVPGRGPDGEDDAMEVEQRHWSHGVRR